MSDTKEQLHLDPSSCVQNGVEASTAAPGATVGHAEATAGHAENGTAKEGAGGDASRAELIEAKRRRIEEIEKSLGKKVDYIDLRYTNGFSVSSIVY